MIFFHGTDMAGITHLVPSSCDREGKRVLYLTDNWAYSLFYLRDRKTDFVTCGVGLEGKVHYDEKFPDQLRIMYQGRKGYIYEVDTVAEPTRTPGIWVTSNTAEVTGCTYIPDAYREIQKEMERGAVDFLPFDKLSVQQRRLNHEGTVRYLLSGKAISPEKIAFYQQHFPEAWAEAQNILAQWKQL